MATRVFLPLVLVFGALFTIGVVYPTLNGPFRVDCGDLDGTTCEEIWREAAHHEVGPTALLPVTRVRVRADPSRDPLTCNSVYIERWIFSTSIANDCL